jgi:hypothetical protein
MKVRPELRAEFRARSSKRPGARGLEAPVRKVYSIRLDPVVRMFVAPCSRCEQDNGPVDRRPRHHLRQLKWRARLSRGTSPTSHHSGSFGQITL